MCTIFNSQKHVIETFHKYQKKLNKAKLGMYIEISLL